MISNANTLGNLNTADRTFDQGSTFPMRVVLIADFGDMFTLLLPSSMEGRYRFTDSSGVEKFPIYFEQQNGRWVANLEDNAFFYSNTKTGEVKHMGKRQALVSTNALRLNCDGTTFIVYAEDERSGDHVFLPYYFEERTDYLIGRTQQNHICYPNAAVSREHARIHWTGSCWSIIDQNSTNGTYVNGKKIDYTELHVGDMVFIVGLYIIVGNGFLAINNYNSRVSFQTPRIRHIATKNDVRFTPPLKGTASYDYFDRKPRKIVKMDTDEIQIEPPPMPLGANNLPLLLRLGTPMLMGGQALMTGNVFMAMTSMVMPALTQGMTEKDRKDYEKKRLEGYREYLRFLTQQIYNEKIKEERELNHNYPSLAGVMQLASTRKRLWDRRKINDDFLEIRVGYGNYPMLAELKYPARHFQIEPDVLEDEMYAIAERPVILENVPVMIPLIKDFIIGMTGQRELMIQLIQNMVMQIVSTHSYDETKIILVADYDDAKELDFIRYLPHNWNDEKSMRFFVTNQSEAMQLTNYLNKEFDDGGAEKSIYHKYDISNGASYVVFALSKTLFDHIEPFKDVLDNPDYKGVSIVAAFQGLPKECGKVIDLRDEFKVIDYFNPEVDDQVFNFDTCDNNLVRETLRTIGETKLRIEGGNYMLPNAVTFLEMYNAGKVEHLNPVKRWEDNDPVKTLAAPIGIGTDGKHFKLDLHEKYHGPHGLVAGMTGSGKSEFLITYILSMAVNYSPDEIAFVLIDYKGGGLADAFEDKNRGIHLPHLVGTITNLDGAAITRSLMSIKSELKRRQAVFKKAKSETNEGTMDIYDYQKLYRSKRVSEPMPHLIIISDEFAEMKQQQPEFMDELISTARIGRSLGVHLILATQKPAGVVNDQIRSNTKFQACLRVQDRADSMDMIKRPDAAELKNAGRFYLQVGYNEFFAQGQSAWCGAEYAPQDVVTSAKDESVVFVDHVGQTVLKSEPEVKKVSTGTKQIVAIVKYLSDLAKRENIEPRSLWLDPLPRQLDFDQLLPQYRNELANTLKVFIGMADDPERQSQYPLIVDLKSFNHMMIGGNSGSGKSSLIRTMLLQLIERYNADMFNYYIIDLSGGALNAFSKMPHCGAYLNESKEGDIDRLFSLVKEMVDERKKIFNEADVTNYNSYTKVGKMPLAMVIIDGYSNIKSLKRGDDYYGSIHELIRSASNYGIMFVLAANHPNEVSVRTKQEMDYSITLNVKDKFEAQDFLDTRCKITLPEIPGRGICLIDGRPIEYHVATPFSSLDEQTQTIKLKERLNARKQNYSSQSVAKVLPTIEDGTEYKGFCQTAPLNTFPIGYSIQSMQPVIMPFQQLYSMSLYFGNPLGVKPVISNLIETGRHNSMDLIIVRKRMDSLFDSRYENEISAGYPGSITILDCTDDGFARFDEILVEQITARNVFRDEYCNREGIPSTDKGRVKRAAKYIREKTKPLFVIFESFSDFCTAEKSEQISIELTAFLSRTKGYNIYFAACYYPNDEIPKKDPIAKAFNSDDLLLFFGGQYSKQTVTADLPMDLRRVDGVNPKYDRFMLKYRGAYHPVLMPCGELSDGATDEDPDEAPII